jgi:hypothetical protein
VFAIAIMGPENELNYWTGDPDMWEADASVAAIFTDESYAEAAIGILRRAIPELSTTVHVVELEEDA